MSDFQARVRPLLWAVNELRGRRDRHTPTYSERSTVANLLWDDGADRRMIRELRDRFQVPIEYTDTLAEVASRLPLPPA